MREVDGNKVYTFLSARSPVGKWEVETQVGGFFINWSPLVNFENNVDTGSSDINYTKLSLTNTSLTYKRIFTYIRQGQLQFKAIGRVYFEVGSSRSTKIKIAIAGGNDGDYGYLCAKKGAGDFLSGSNSAPPGFDLYGAGTLQFDYENPNGEDFTVLILGGINRPGSTTPVNLTLNLQSAVLNSGESGSGNYTCTCPDFAKKIDAFTKKFYTKDKVYESEAQPRNWTNSDAGTDEYCKHILSVMRYRGEPIPKYLDVPEV